MHNGFAAAVLKGMTAHHGRIEKGSELIVRRRELSVVRSAWMRSLKQLMTLCFECCQTSPFAPQAPQVLRSSPANLAISVAVR